MANPPAKKSTSAKPAPKKNGSSGRPAGLFTWVAVGLVAVVIAVLVLVKVLGGSSSTSPSGAFEQTPQSLVNQLTQVPAATFDTVGVTSPAINVTPPSATKNQPVLEWADSSGVKRPTVYYFGSEYCPYCAAERWPLIIALSRFGTWNMLGNSQSSSTDVYKNTQTFTFLKATYASKYLNFSSIENLSNVPANTPQGYTVLQTPSKEQNKVFTTYDSAGSIPFISIGNQYIVIGASYSPSALTGLTREQIAGNLSDSTNYLTQGLLTAANYMTSGLCALTHNQPSNVCTSPAVKAANRVYGR